MTTPLFFDPHCKMSCNFSLQLKERRHPFLALGVMKHKKFISQIGEIQNSLFLVAS